MHGVTLDRLAEALADGRLTSRALVDACLDRIASKDGQGATAFTLVDFEGARAQAMAMDQDRRTGMAPSRFAGIPIAIKDLFDVEGQVTRAGSRVLGRNPPALCDAVAVARLRQAGFVLIGRTNMTEFAYSGLGLNPHYGTPLSSWRREDRHIAGGSTSGGAVAVADAMAFGALGSDTGGSCRIPAAWCGLTGFKPTASRVSRSGTIPLSTTLDSIGTIGNSVDCVASMDAILSDEPDALRAIDIRGLRLVSPTNLALDDVDDAVASSFDRAIANLQEAGAIVCRTVFPMFDEIAALNAKGGIAAAESWAWHRSLIAEAGDEYDPRVISRIKRGADQQAADYIDILAARLNFAAAVQAFMADFDAMIMPTTPMVPPRLADLASDEEYGRINLLSLRNPSIVNLFNGCSVSIPMHLRNEAPAGLMIAGLAGKDRTLLDLARSIESVLAGSREPRNARDPSMGAGPTEIQSRNESVLLTSI